MFAEYPWLRWNQLIVITEGRLERSRGCNEKGDYADDLEGWGGMLENGWVGRGDNDKTHFLLPLTIFFHHVKLYIIIIIHQRKGIS